METIYTILFTASHMEPLLFAAMSRSKLGSKVRRHINELIIDDPSLGEPLGQYEDLDRAAGWLAEQYGYQFEVTTHAEDL